MLLGIIFIYYAANRHALSVLVEKEVEIPSPPPNVDPAILMQLPPDEQMKLLTPPPPKKEKRDVPETRFEPAIVQGVTIDGYTMLPSGAIKYIYGAG